MDLPSTPPGDDGRSVRGAPDRPVPALEARGLVVELGGRRVLDGVSVAVRQGAMVAVVGPNGAGKTSLVRALAGLLPVAAGAVEVEGRPVASYRRRELARILSTVPQGDVRADDLTVQEFVELGRFPWIGPWGALGEEDVAAVEGALEVTATGAFRSRRLGSLSGGERQRVVIAAAIAQGGRTLLLDEPTAALDVRHQIQVLELLERLHRGRGLTVVAVTHDLNTLVAASDTVLALRSGTVAYEGAPGELFDPPVLEEVFEATFLRVAREGGGPPVVVPAGGGR